MTRGEVAASEPATLLLDDNGREVRVGDRLIPVEAQPYDLQFFPHPPKAAAGYGRCRSLAVADMLTSGGPRDVVAISGGSREGIDNGTVFSIWREGSGIVDRQHDPEDSRTDRKPTAARAEMRLPDEFAGHVMVFRTFDKVSYGLVMEGIKPTASATSSSIRTRPTESLAGSGISYATSRRRPRAPSLFAAEAGRMHRRRPPWPCCT